jgi:hypothetical protein
MRTLVCWSKPADEMRLPQLKAADWGAAKGHRSNPPLSAPRYAILDPLAVDIF